MKRPARDHRFFETWARRNGMKPVVRVANVEIEGEVVADVLIADSEVILSQGSFPNTEHELPFFFRTGYAFDRPGDGTWIACFSDYPPDAFSEYAGDSRKQARVEDAMRDAVAKLAHVHRVRLFNGNDRRFN